MAFAHEVVPLILKLRDEFQGNITVMFTSCIMCVQYIGGCSVRRRVFSTSGDTLSTSGGYHEYIRGCSVHRGDIMSTLGGYHEYLGDIMSTSGDVQYIGGCHDACGGAR